MITKVTLADDFTVLATLLNESFATVASDFGLTKENCPTNNAFINAEDLRSQLVGSSEFFYYSIDGEIVGFITIEKSHTLESVYYIEKVAVYPAYRHRSIGKQLMNFVTLRIKELGGTKISIGVIAQHEKLIKWYRGQGFIESGVKSFDHLPFTVCYLEKQCLSK